MKVAVSFLSSKFDFCETIKKINETSAEYIHTDIMDGKYVENNNYDLKKIIYLEKCNRKKCDVHLLVENPYDYLNNFKDKIFELIYFHPKTTEKPEEFINELKLLNKKIGIVINPEDEIQEFNNLYKEVDYILVMCVTPGAGGQKFMTSSLNRIDMLNQIKHEKGYKFKIALDGGINGETIESVKNKDIEYVVSGSFICHSDNYEGSLNKLI